jgi:N6-adenosine-specific RNA methylase IME4
MESEKKYGIVYADPPWQYKVYSDKGKGRSAENHYPTMTIEDISALPISEIVADDAVLFLWITFPMLLEGFRVIEAWGFRYKTVAFVWIKLNRKKPSLFWGLGFWTRANAEICLLATKGKPKRISAKVHQVIMSPVEEHSKKPDESRKRIEALLGDISRIELFARGKTDGWDVWGNEVKSDIAFEVKEKVKGGDEYV